MKNFQKGFSPILIILITAIVAGGVGFLFWKYKSENGISSPSPTVTSSPSPTPTDSLIVGGDRDEHGCIGSAGYSWCEAKQKCIRVWEEDCLSAEAIKSLLMAKYNKKSSELSVKISKENSQYAVGGVSFGPEGTPGGLFMATKTSGNWELVYDGNGSIDCVKIKKDYNFPKEMLKGICD